MSIFLQLLVFLLKLALEASKEHLKTLGDLYATRKLGSTRRRLKNTYLRICREGMCISFSKAQTSLRIGPCLGAADTLLKLKF